MDRSVAFYRDLLGLKPTMLSAFWTEFQVGANRIALHPTLKGCTPPHGEVGKGWYLGVQVEDVKALRQKLMDAGVPIVDDFHDVPGGVLITFPDPDGNPIQAIQLGVKTADLG